MNALEGKRIWQYPDRSQMVALWAREMSYRSTRIVVERLPHGWRLTLGGNPVERRTLVEAFEAVTGHNAGFDELALVLAALASAHAESPADAALTRELGGIDVDVCGS